VPRCLQLVVNAHAHRPVHRVPENLGLRDVARSAIGRRVRAYHASDLLLITEVVSLRSGSERTDRVQKVGEYAKAGLAPY
jgi:hypothetical protein